MQYALNVSSDFFIIKLKWFLTEKLTSFTFLSRGELIQLIISKRRKCKVDANPETDNRRILKGQAQEVW